MVDPAYVARVRAYLEQHRQTYDQAALRAKLLADGHPAQVVDLALAQVYGYEPPAPPAASSAQPGSGTRLALTIVATFIMTYVLIGAFLAITFNKSGEAWLLLPLAVLPLEIVAALLVRRRDRQLARGIAWGIAAAWLPIAGLALLFGICLALIGGF